MRKYLSGGGAHDELTLFDGGGALVLSADNQYTTDGATMRLTELFFGGTITLGISVWKSGITDEGCDERL